MRKVPPPDPGESNQAQALPGTPETPPEQSPSETSDAAAQQAEANVDAPPPIEVPKPGRPTRPLPRSINPPEQAPENLEPSEEALPTANVPPIAEEPAAAPGFSMEDLQADSVPEGRIEKHKTEEQIIYLSPEEDLTSIYEHLKRVADRRIILVILAQTQLRSHVVWRLLHARARELGKEVLVVSSDRQIRALAKASGFMVADTLESTSSGRPRPGGRPLRPGSGRITPPGRYPSPGRRDQSAQPPITAGDQRPTSQEPQSPANDISANPVTNPSETAGDPFAFDEDTLPPSLPEQHAVPADTTGEDVPEITNNPTGTGANYEIEDMGDYDIAEDYTIAKAIREDASKPSPQPISFPSSAQKPALPPTTRNIPLPRPSTGRSIAARSGAGVEAKTPSSRSVPPPRRPPGGGGRPPLRTSLPGRGVPPSRNRGSQRGILRWIIPAALILLLLLGFIVFGSGLLSGLAPSATVTITPARANLKNTYLISAVTGVPLASQRQVQERLLSYTTSSQTQTVKVTGSGDIPAVAARGSLTFYNALSYSQTIAAGTVFIDAAGVQVTNDKTVILPAAHPPTEGMVAVPTHAINTGTNGNIPAFDFNSVPCCTSGVTIQNLKPFSGGRDQVNYTFVQQSDIDGVVNALKASLIPAAQATLKTQIRSNERFIGPIQCAPNIITDHSAGDKTTSITVTVTATCSDKVYDQQGALTMAAMLLHNQAMANLGAGYALVGNVATTITQAKVADTNKSTIVLFVNAEGVWVYRFSNAQKQELAKLIAGKNANDAQTLLLHQVGIAKADVQVSWLSGSTLPADPNAITMMEQNVS